MGGAVGRRAGRTTTAQRAAVSAASEEAGLLGWGWGDATVAAEHGSLAGGGGATSAAVGVDVFVVLGGAAFEERHDSLCG